MNPLMSNQPSSGERSFEGAFVAGTAPGNSSRGALFDGAGTTAGLLDCAPTVAKVSAPTSAATRRGWVRVVFMESDQ